MTISAALCFCGLCGIVYRWKQKHLMLTRIYCPVEFSRLNVDIVQVNLTF